MPPRVALPRAEIAEDAVVGDLSPSGENDISAALVDRQAHGQAAVDAER